LTVITKSVECVNEPAVPVNKALQTGSTQLVTGAGTFQAAATVLGTAAPVLQTAATTLQAAAASLQAAGEAGGSGGIGDLFGNGGGGGGGGDDFPGFASGTDDASGGFAWVGERGPELMKMPGGTSITPAASLRSGGGGDQHFYIDAKGAEIGVEEKIVRALAAAKPRFIGEALANFSDVQQRTPPSR
jgi:hypothetical protein